MPSQNDKARDFGKLHVPGRPLILFNAWDAGSARVIARSGAKAIGTSSWSVAAACGCEDGENLSREVAIQIFGRIAKATDLPVSVDIESGYGTSPAEVGETVRQAIESGAIGFNLEDSVPGDGTLRAIAEQVERISAARSAILESGIECFLNARTDVYFQPAPAEHGQEAMAAALERAEAYARAGANGLFAPGLSDLSAIRQIASRSPLPLNVMIGDDSPPIGALCEAGVARVSYGPAPYAVAMGALEARARGALAA